MQVNSIPKYKAKNAQLRSKIKDKILHFQPKKEKAKQERGVTFPKVTKETNKTACLA